MREIAARSGFAPITVSRALSSPEKVSKETRDRILEVVRELNFVPNNVAGSMRSPSRIIATIVPPIINLGIAEQVKGMSDASQAAGYQFLLVQGELTGTAEEKAIRALLGWRPAGFVLQAFVKSKASRELLTNYGAPIVEISEIRGRQPIDTAVGLSNFETAYAMTTYLIDKGYKRIGFVNVPAHGNDRLSQRGQGYRAALADRRRKHGPSQEIEVPLTPHGGTLALNALMSRKPAIDAIFFSSDSLALAAIQEAHRQGWDVPGDVAIAGYGDLDFAQELYPRLTTVQIPRYEMGKRAVETLVSRIDGRLAPGGIFKLDFAVVERESA
jgi:LacI family gluconate utilization system Gnt-I transcriptional repressor